MGLSDPSGQPARPTPSGLPTDFATARWDDRLSAVTASLRLAVGVRDSGTGALLADAAAGRVRASVLECVAALDRLQATLAREFDRRRQLEREVFDAQEQLGLARAELVGMQAGERHARHLALHDPLTTLPNRSLFGDQLVHALGRLDPQCPSLAVLYIDLDGFKAINDRHGHHTGDELLRIAAARLARAVRAEDVMSRLGGDEFACLIPDFLDRGQLVHLACKLFDAVSAPLTIGTLTLTVRPSIGIAICPGDGATAEALLRNADAAMYRAKRRRTGYAFFDRLPEARIGLPTMDAYAGPGFPGAGNVRRTVSD